MKQEKFEKKVEDYLSGRLTRKEIETLWTELIKNPTRLEYLKNIVNAREAAIDLTKEQKIFADDKTEPTKVSSPYIKYAVAATIAIIIGVLSVFNYSSQEIQDVKPIETIELNYYRSESGDVSAEPDRVRDVINQAINLANSGETERAISLLKQKRSNVETPEMVASLSLNIGSLQYNAGNYDQAIRNFEKVINQREKIDVLTLEKGYWFMGNAYFQKGQLKQARSLIRKAYELDGAYRRVAGTYLNAMAEK